MATRTPADPPLPPYPWDPESPLLQRWNEFMLICKSETEGRSLRWPEDGPDAFALYMLETSSKGTEARERTKKVIKRRAHHMPMALEIVKMEENANVQ